MAESGNHLESAQIDSLIWDYDARGQVVYEQVKSAFNAGAVQYFYDPSGNRKLQLNCPREIACNDSVVYVIGELDNRLDRRIRWVPADTAQSDYRYDWNGRLVLQIDSTNDEGGVVTILKPRFHSTLGRLIDAEVVNVRSATDSAWFAYDVLGRRIKGTFPREDAYTFHDGTNVASHFDADFVHGPGLDDPLMVFNPGPHACNTGGDRAYFGAIQGRLVAFLAPDGTDCIYADRSAGIETLLWQEYASNAGAIRNSRSFSLERSGEVESLSYFRNRYYDAATGRFIEEDPIGFDGGLNLYAYAGNNPATFTDPFGLCPPEDDEPCSRWQRLANWGAQRGGVLGDLALNVGAGLEAFGAVAQAVSPSECSDQGICYAMAPAIGPRGVPATVMGRSVASLQSSLRGGGGAWLRTSAHAEAAAGRAYRGGTSMEEIFRNAETGEQLVRHTIYRGGELLHETFRRIAKFGAQ